MEGKFVVFDENMGVIDGSTDLSEAREKAKFYAKRDGENGIGFDVESPHDGGGAPPSTNPPKDPLTENGLRFFPREEVYYADEKTLWRDMLEVLPPYFPSVGVNAVSGKRSGFAPYNVVVRDASGRWDRRTHKDFAALVRSGDARGLLKKNAKLSKTGISGNEKPAYALGLSLIPSVMAMMGRDSNGDSIMPQSEAAVKAGWDPNWTPGHFVELPTQRFNLCPRATDECIRSCLVKTGQNDEVKNFNKLLQTYALMRHPQHFLYLLDRALRDVAGRSTFSVEEPILGPDGQPIMMRNDKVKVKREPFTPDRKFVRLNVFSDIAWERMAPWLFDKRGLGFYDYTKVEDRIVSMNEDPAFPKNYDLTFSYSGKNTAACLDFLVRGYAKVAVVLLHPKSLWKDLWKRGQNYLAIGGQEFPVVDGDRHDFRPYDEPGRWVALRWKSPKGFRMNQHELDRLRKEHPGRDRDFRPADVIRKFVIRAETDGNHWVVSQQPRNTLAADLVAAGEDEE